MTRRFEIPLLADHHNHPLLYSVFREGVDLSGVSSEDDAVAAIRAGATASGRLTIAHGWNDSRFAFRPAALDALPPVVIFNVSLHGLELNDTGAALLAAHDPDAVGQLRDQLWFDRNLRVVLNLFASVSATVEGLTAFYDWLVTQGVWSAEEMLLVNAEEIDLFREAGLLDRTRFWVDPPTYRALSPAQQADVYGLKLFTDGAIGTRSAALTESFRGGDVGRLLYDDAGLIDEIAGCLATTRALAIHAIGDRAIDQVIATLEQLEPAVRDAPDVRIEHAQFISPEMARTAKRLGLTLSMQPNFSADTAQYRDRLSSETLAQNNPFRMLIDDVGFVPGADLVLGSDGMPHGAAEALRQSLFPPEPGQVLTIDEFVAGYCVADGAAKLIVDVGDGTVSVRVAD